jgi:HEPN domain-containing protein
VVDRIEFDRWQAAAEEARRAAETAARAGHHNWACFLAEQSAQLSLKGLLHGLGAGAWSQDVVDLGRALSEAVGDALSESLSAGLQRLSRHYIPARYPDAHPAGSPGDHYGFGDVEQALADLEAIQSFVVSTWEELTRVSATDEEAGDAP